MQYLVNLSNISIRLRERYYRSNQPFFELFKKMEKTAIPAIMGLGIGTVLYAMSIRKEERLTSAINNVTKCPGCQKSVAYVA